MKQSIGFHFKQRCFLVFCASLMYHGTMAQGEPFILGARAWGLGNATVADTDVSSQGANIAGVAEIEEPHFLAGYDTFYGLPGIEILAVAAVVPLQAKIVSAIGIVRFGDAFYHELQASLGLAHRIERISLGIRVSYLQQAFNIPSLVVSRQAVVVEMGGQVLLSRQLRMGAHAYNLFQSAYSGDQGSRVPTILKLGFQYEPMEKLSLAAELYKHTSRPAAIRTGLCYQPITLLSLRTGLSAGPMTHHFGLGLQAQPFSFDYAVHTHNRLGWSHHLSIGYRMKRGIHEEVGMK